MTIQAPNAFRQNRTTRLVLVAILLLLASGFFIYTRATAPEKDIANGVYRNQCCGDILIDDGKISQNGKIKVITLKNMKFGLTGHVRARFTREGMQDSDEETAILFHNEGDRWALTLPIDRRDYTFRSVEGTKAR